jgi:hypothetical protein
MNEVSVNPKCDRCERILSAEKPVRLPDTRVYCAACCESMAADDFEMETGESFTKWIEKHPVLVMKYQPLELNVRKYGFFFPFFVSLLGIAVLLFGFFRGKTVEQHLPSGEVILLWEASIRWTVVALGVVMAGFFGALAWRGGREYLRARNFKLTLQNGIFDLQYGPHKETFNADEITQACVVRPGTVGATEGALGLRDGRMLTLDTCLSDLHALRVVMDLRFREDFPPSADDLAKVRRDKLRKIRGLS